MTRVDVNKCFDFCIDLFCPGTDVTIVAHSLGVQKALEGAEELEKEGINCEVNNCQLLYLTHAFNVIA